MPNPLIHEFKNYALDAARALADMSEAVLKTQREVKNSREATLRAAAQSRKLLAEADRILVRR